MREYFGFFVFIFSFYKCDHNRTTVEHNNFFFVYIPLHCRICSDLFYISCTSCTVEWLLPSACWVPMNTPHQPSYMQCKRLRHCACVVAEKPEPINGIVLGPPGALTPKAATGRAKMYTLARANTHTQHIDAHAKRPSVATVSGHWHRHRVIVVAHTHSLARSSAHRHRPFCVAVVVAHCPGTSFSLFSLALSLLCTRISSNTIFDRIKPTILRRFKAAVPGNPNTRARTLIHTPTHANAMQ